MQMREKMDRLFSQFLRRGDGEEVSWGQGHWAPPVVSYETDSAFMPKAELPGFSKEDVNIEIHENRLIIHGEHKRETEARGDRYHRLERAYGRFERAFGLPTMVDAEHIQASFKNGVLELSLLKSATAKPKQIPITEAEVATGNGRRRAPAGAEPPR
jgi:HSP20 family protein